MDALKLSFLVLMLNECYYSTEAMGLCDFAEKFPCENTGGSVCFTRPGCNSQFPKEEIRPNHATTNLVATDQVANDTETPDQVSTAPLCPPNMLYANCTACQGTCLDPKACISKCNKPETCVCPDRFLFKGDDCVPEEECGCFIEGQGVIPDGEYYVTFNCLTRCNCSAGQLICESDYQCSSNAVCEERNNLRQCYCKAGYTGNGVICTSDSPPTDCLDVFNSGYIESSVYNIKPTTWSGSPFEVYCNMTDRGGWTVLQRRIESGSVDFFVFWDDYKQGFGLIDNELWLGNEKIFSLTNQRSYQLRIDFVNKDGAPYYAKYDFFRINNEGNNYQLTVGTYIDGDAGDSLRSNNNMNFCTRDRDNDDNVNTHYASNVPYDGAWWWGTPGSVDLNPNDKKYIHWSTIPGANHIKFTEMKIRPV